MPIEHDHSRPSLCSSRNPPLVDQGESHLILPLVDQGELHLPSPLLIKGELKGVKIAGISLQTLTTEPVGYTSLAFNDTP